MQAETKNIYLVLGVARSGTSAITKGLQALGIDLGQHLTPAHHAWNPTGFWEDTEVVYKINGRLFFALNFKPYGILSLPTDEQFSEKAIPIRNEAIQLVNQRFQTTNHWALKDPSMVKVLPFWQSIFTELHIKDHYIITLRNPLATAESYYRLTGTDIEIGLLLWLYHLLPAINGTQSKNRVIVSYDLLLKNPNDELSRIQQTLAITTNMNPQAIEDYAHHFLDKKLHHYTYSDADLFNHPSIAIAPLCQAIYQLLLQVAKDEISWDDPSFITRWHDINLEANKLQPIYNYLDQLLKKNHALTAELHTIQESTLWKLTSPLRQLARFRKRRKKSPEGRRLVKAYG